MNQFFYGSRAIHPLGHVTNVEILRASLAFNPGASLTGYLLRTRLHFFQVLEGEPEVVSDLMQRIKADHRHFDIVTLVNHTVAHRAFGDWSMSYAEVGQENIGSSLMANPVEGSPEAHQFLQEFKGLVYSFEGAER